MSNQGRTIICTVGASAIDWLRKNRELIPQEQVQPLLECFADKGSQYKAKNQLLLIMQNYYHNEKYRALWPAEITSLAAIGLSKQDKLFFVAGTRIEGKPDEGAVCAEALAEYYSTRPDNSIPAYCKLATGFVITPRKDEAGNDVKNFDDPESMLRTLDEIASQERHLGGPDKPIIFNVTPGYKPSVIYAALVGLVYGCELYYTQIDMTEPLVVPAIPTQVLSEESLNQEDYEKIKDTTLGKLYDNVPVKSSSGPRYHRKKLVEIVDQMPRASWDKDKGMSQQNLPKTKVLFLSADPSDQARLRLGEEYDEISKELERAAERDKLDLLNPGLAVGPDNFIRALINNKPQVVHFSGHGAEDGQLYFVKNRESFPADPDTLSDLFSQINMYVKCVVLNACYSQAQAKAIAQHIEYVVGMNSPITDDAAVSFAKGFYTGLGAGKLHDQADLYETAFKLGCLQIGIGGNAKERQTPTLYKNGQLIQGQTPSSSEAAGNSTATHFSIEVELTGDTATSVTTYRGGQPATDLHSELITILNEAGYRVQATRSDFLTIVGQLAQNVTDHQALLVVLFETAKTAIESLIKLRTRHEAEGTTIKISLEVDGQSISIEAPDVESAEKLLDKFQTAYPDTTKQITANSKLKVKGQASKGKK